MTDVPRIEDSGGALGMTEGVEPPPQALEPWPEVTLVGPPILV